MKKFDGCLLLTDLDGTLLRNDKSISEENRRAIAAFMQEGGRFSFVSGRAPIAMRELNALLHPNAPVGCLNGGGLYDFATDRMLWSAKLAPCAPALGAYIAECFPDMGIEIFTEDEVCFCRENSFTEQHQKDEGLIIRRCDFGEITGKPTKLLFALREEQFPLLREALLQHPDIAKFDMVRTDRHYFELLCPGVNKAESVRRLQALLPEIHTVLAVGDNDNDAPMLRQATHAWAVANASQAAREAAGRITVSNQDHAIAAVLREWETEYCR